MLTEELLYDRLYALYRLITIKYNIKVDDLITFIKYVYAMDTLWLNTVYRPFIWEDYIFIDDAMFADFINRNGKNPILHENDFDHLAKIDHRFFERIVNEGIINNLKYKLPINHIDHIPVEGKAYFEDLRDTKFFFSVGDYESRLKLKRREIQLNELLN